MQNAPWHRVHIVSCTSGAGRSDCRCTSQSWRFRVADVDASRELSAGETALILGATGVTGQLAVQIAKLLGAKRVIGAGETTARLRGCANWARKRRFNWINLTMY